MHHVQECLSLLEEPLVGKKTCQVISCNAPSGDLGTAYDVVASSEAFESSADSPEPCAVFCRYYDGSVVESDCRISEDTGVEEDRHEVIYRRLLACFEEFRKHDRAVDQSIRQDLVIILMFGTAFDDVHHSVLECIVRIS